MTMVRFGPSGNSDLFYAQGYKQSVQAPEWLKSLGLGAFEISFGRGVRMGAQTAQAIGAQARQNDILLSVHAPYYINFANIDADKRRQSTDYILQSARVALQLGADRIVFHPGACKENADRSAAMHLVKQSVLDTLAAMRGEGLDQIAICPETMGKMGQLGTVEEVLSLCQLDEALIPCLDFGHINARSLGGLKQPSDFEAVLDKLEAALGKARAHRMHVHFSRIEFTQMGEKRHWTLDDTQYGPEFEPLGALLAKRGYQCRVICESKGTMAEDAVRLQLMYRQSLQKMQ